MVPALVIILILLNYSLYVIRPCILSKRFIGESIILYFIKCYLRCYPRYLVYILSLSSPCSLRLFFLLIIFPILKRILLYLIISIYRFVRSLPGS